MKRAVILHGTDGKPDYAWMPWIKAKLESKGYEVWAPLLPENHTPNRQRYNDFLFGSGWDFTDNIIIGHSSGAVAVLNLLMDERCPKIKTGILIGAWAGGLPGTYEEGNTQFDNLFPPDGFNFDLIKSKAGKLIFMHSNDDPYCPLEQARWLAEQTQSEIMVIPDAQHLSSSRNPEFPELLQVLEEKAGL